MKMNALEASTANMALGQGVFDQGAAMAATYLHDLANDFLHDYFFGNRRG